MNPAPICKLCGRRLFGPADPNPLLQLTTVISGVVLAHKACVERQTAEETKRD